MIKNVAFYPILFFSVISFSNSETINPKVDEKISTSCECLAAFSGCESEYLASAAGKPTHSWVQENYLKKGVPANLNAACYRKRNVKGMGDSLCCEFTKNEDKTISNLFRGTKN